LTDRRYRRVARRAADVLPAGAKPAPAG